MDIIELQKNESLVYTNFVGDKEFILYEGAELYVYNFNLDSTVLDSNVIVELIEPNAKVFIYGVNLCDGRDVSTQFVVSHRAEKCFSRQMFRAVTWNGGKSSFNGTIIVDGGARKTEAYQSSKSLILDGKSQAFSKPELFINNDDVICSHGSTVGRLDNDQLFYLMSRGLPRHKAVKILIQAFIRELIPEDSREYNKVEEILNG